MWFLYLLIFFSFSFSVSAEIDQNLRAQLFDMAKADQDIRKELGEAGWHQAPKELREKLLAIDEENTLKLKSILRERSWFTESEIGKDGVGAAFLIIQHSPDYEFKENMLPVLKQSYLNDEGITGQEVALLTDRILISKGQKQRYGTQAKIGHGKVIFEPVSNPESVDERRSEMEIPPLEFYQKLLEEMYGIKDYPEIDLSSSAQP
ncbi:DUF6624 domain-containing protein [Photobacterium galatheae]|uniref:Uncharacterized protein n=1 Tax=Photobacterium galatheae TaxID=1654360 RepID=A0A066RRF8_9GAMM|nr:DUF6624 domain-containing protein [Photobacterium galatheae]KDM91661.1 hypothetical protein EA58_11625 [Photobacterium galatheae]MCM0149735.1 hypothetical protein [Photobacterium galatheae]